MQLASIVAVNSLLWGLNALLCNMIISRVYSILQMSLVSVAGAGLITEGDDKGDAVRTERFDS